MDKLPDSAEEQSVLDRIARTGDSADQSGESLAAALSRQMSAVRRIFVHRFYGEQA